MSTTSCIVSASISVPQKRTTSTWCTMGSTPAKPANSMQPPLHTITSLKTCSNPTSVLPIHRRTCHRFVPQKRLTYKPCTSAAMASTPKTLPANNTSPSSLSFINTDNIHCLTLCAAAYLLLHSRTHAVSVQTTWRKYTHPAHMDIPCPALHLPCVNPPAHHCCRWFFAENHHISLKHTTTAYLSTLAVAAALCLAA